MVDPAKRATPTLRAQYVARMADLGDIEKRVNDLAETVSVQGSGIDYSGRALRLIHDILQDLIDEVSKEPEQYEHDMGLLASYANMTRD